MGHLKSGENSSGKNIVMTSGSVGTVKGMANETINILDSKTTLRESNHSHGMPPGDSHYPSGMPGTTTEGRGDVGYTRQSTARANRMGLSEPKFNIYIPNENLYIPFAPNSKVSDYQKYYNPSLPFGGMPLMKK